MDDTGRRPLRSGLALVGWVVLAAAYRDLLTLGPRYGVESGVEYWLFVPNDRAPVMVLLLSAWLTWRRWPRLKRIPVQLAPTPWIALALGLGALTYAWSIHVRAEDLQAISLISNLAGLVLLRWGLPGLRVMRLPLVFLVFCLPIPAPLLVTLLWDLRLITAEYTGWLLYLLGVPALVSGDQIVRATQTFQVIEGCSGLRSAETLTMLVVLLVDLFGRSGRHAALLLLSAPFVAFALNGIRVLTIVMNPHSEVLAVHSLQGIGILLVGLLSVYVFDGILARVLSRRREPTPAVETPARSARLPALSANRYLGALLGVAVVTAGAGLLLPPWSAPRPGPALEALAGEALGAIDYEEIEAEPYFLGRMHFRDSIHRSYATPRTPVEVFVGSADLRNRGSSIISRITSFPGSGWETRETRLVQLTPEGPEARVLVIEKGTETRLVYHWLVGVADLASESLRSFLGLERSGFHRLHGQLAVRLSTGFGGSGQPVGRQRAEERLQRMFEKLDLVLRTAAWPPLPEPERQDPGARR
ncbi:MAG: exosortase/archaeosortase family protein [Myxococcota bacterium]